MRKIRDGQSRKYRNKILHVSVRINSNVSRSGLEKNMPPNVPEVKIRQSSTGA